ncbi:sure-like protein [Gloeophyllum trabeum ATCC 11539]|uniref:Sure-like protein n=1 Tax=Gloeophyllum trabeum (strain ATCC 11539 / FP-39264 / Madison 617) TaxID=670483 RepID=S7Q8D4_GLOTA|nr:sure-like protein [Gloeophyllum trabeum ATCC 11539]EPQ55703.1 sure-like protein [Gloeophyllum trabeum ATCC 11539]
MRFSTLASCLAAFAVSTNARWPFYNVVLTNDDGWAVAMIRAQNEALKAAGYDVVLSCPSQNESGTGSTTAAPTVLNITCEYDTCAVGSPPEGFNASDPRLNYVNAYPVDSIRYGIQTLAPKFFGAKPEFVVSGPNVGNNLGSAVTGSGTVGAACEAAKEGIPSVAFSGDTLQQISYTTLESEPTSQYTQAAEIYSQLTVKFTRALLALPGTILPTGISVNVNYPSITNCTSVDDYKFVLTRITEDADATDVFQCGSVHLPQETGVVRGEGCYASVSVFDANTKADVDAGTQAFVRDKLFGLLTCYDG